MDDIEVKKGEVEVEDRIKVDDSTSGRSGGVVGDRDARGRLLPGHSLRWKKGQAPNPKGSNYADKLLKAIKKVEKKYKINYWERCVEISLGTPQVMTALLKKFVPDRIFQEGDTEKIVNYFITHYGHDKKEKDSAQHAEQNTPKE